MTPVLIEVCVGSASDAGAAARAGADRIELNRALDQDGLTPSVADVRDAVESVDVPVIVMVRPHDVGFVYSGQDFATMLDDVDAVLDAGAHGIVAGVLTADACVDRGRMGELVIRAKGRPVVFHRAFDRVEDPVRALEGLIDMGVTRILTSGQRPTAIEGAGLLADLIDQAAGRIEILPGAGVGPGNAHELVELTGCTQLHGSFRGDGSVFDATRFHATRAALTPDRGLPSL